MNKAYKFRIYPTNDQQILINKTFGCCRKVWNLMLNDKIENYKQTNSFGKQTPAMYKEKYSFLKEIDSLALANVQMNLQTAFKNHFDKKRKTNTEFPKFKSKHKSKKAYTTNNQTGTISIIDERYIKLPKIGKVRAILHRLPNSDWIIKSATVSQMGDGTFYVSVLFEFEQDVIQSKLENVIGLDYASDGLYVDSSGNKGTNHKFYRESHKKLAKEQRKLSRKIGSKKDEKKSNNFKKQLLKVNKIYRHIANQRNDNLHKISTEIANQYDVVCVESLNMKAISNKKFHNGKATMDNGYGMFCDMLKYKLAERGKSFIKISKWYPSSQTCSCCGARHKEMKDLSIRTLKCNCGLEIDRDYNAAINIKNEGLRLLTIN